MGKKSVMLKGRPVGSGHQVFIIAEIGINHNGDMELAKNLIDVAKDCGCDAVKFQKRNPEKCVPPDMRDKMRDTPWGYISYIDYRRKIEFGIDEYHEISQYCKKREIQWFASCWDEDSVDFMLAFDPPVMKIPSAMATNKELIKKMRETKKPVILSTGMCTMEQIRNAVKLHGLKNLMLAHCTSTYPCPKEELNLLAVSTLRNEFDCPVGYSGHEIGLATTVATVALGATFIERHITMNRALWGSDQSASIEPQGLARLVKDIRNVEMALGTGIKIVYQSEVPAIKRLRIVDNLISSSKK